MTISNTPSSGLPDMSALIKAVISIVVAGAVYLFLPAEEPARRAAFLFVFAALFWAMEVIPLYATSMLVILLCMLTLTQPDGGILNLGPSGFEQFLSPFASPVIILFFGGFVLATAFNKYSIDRLIARYLMRAFGTRPFWILVGLTCTTALLSMWMSNTATAAMMIAMVRPLYEQLDRDDPFRTGLVLSIPFGANIGGIGTPVGTPPNAIVLGVLAQQDPPVSISFIRWMMMAVPLAVILLLVAVIVIYFMFPPKHKAVNLNISGATIIDNKMRAVMGIGLLTVLLWLTSELHDLPEALVGLTGASLFAMSGLLSRDDFKKLDWDVLILMWGGLALGRAMGLSELSDWIVHLPLFDHQGMLLFIIACFLGVFMSTVMSNTATATLLIPIVVMLPGADHVMLSVMVALSCSFAMALPVSTPPNAIAFASNCIKGHDLFRAGGLVSIISLVVLLLSYKIFIPVFMGF